jgi:hypothetical protein
VGQAPPYNPDLCASASLREPISWLRPKAAPRRQGSREVAPLHLPPSIGFVWCARPAFVVTPQGVCPRVFPGHWLCLYGRRDNEWHDSRLWASKAEGIELVSLVPLVAPEHLAGGRRPGASPRRGRPDIDHCCFSLCLSYADAYCRSSEIPPARHFFDGRDGMVTHSCRAEGYDR